MTDGKSDDRRAAVAAAVDREQEKWTGIGGFFRFLLIDIVLGMLRGILSLLSRAP